MRQLEKEMIKEMEEHLLHGVESPDFLVNLFSSSIQRELSVYSQK